MSKKKKKYFINHHDIPQMLFADVQGNIYDHPDLLMTGMSFDEYICPGPEELIELPENSKLFYLPETKPIGFDPLTQEYVAVDTVDLDGEEVEVFAVSAFLEPGYARLYLPSADYSQKTSRLPLWSYTAVGITNNGKLMVTAFPVEVNRKWNPNNYDDRELIPSIEKYYENISDNRLVNHLKKCATEYHCFAAKNLFLQRWEAPLPVSQKCNSKCLGCLSLQKSTCASHERIKFRPSVEEIVEISVLHLNKAEEAMVSFGQGCEGEPLTEADLIEEAIVKIREKTKKGSINLNTNGSMPDKIEALIKAGLDSIRISINSLIKEKYEKYFKPIDYSLNDVIKSAKLSKENGIFTMINYLIFPGLNDCEEEFEELKKFIRYTEVDFIHFKNLCIDPDFYVKQIGRGKGDMLGIRSLFELLKEEFPKVEIGYFNKNISVYLGYE